MTMTINGTSGLVFNDASTQNTAATGFGFKNRIINGAMVIDQRNAGAATAGNGFPVDRFQIPVSQSAKLTTQQNQGAVTPPTGFTNYLGVTSSSAYSSLSGDYFVIYQGIEGYNIADLGWGTANAKTVTLSFQVYSSLTGTFGGALRNSATVRSYPFSYSIPVANTWTTISITIPGDTSGTWVTNNGMGIALYFDLGSGTSTKGTAGAWNSNGNIGATGTVSVVGTNGATFYITGVQLEKGSTATSFDYRPYGTELQLCQRYYQRSAGQVGVADGYGGTGWAYIQCQNLNWIGGNLPFKVNMRAAPTFRNSGFAGTIGTVGRASTVTDSTVSLQSSLEGTCSQFSSNVATASESIMFRWDANSEL
jgi:hypothetical protein